MDAIMNATVGQLIGGGLGIIAVLSIFIEVIPVKINPVSFVLNWIGKRTNKELFAKVEELEAKIADIDSNQKTLEADFAERNAINCRVRILRFGDELRRKIKHSQESFDQAFDDIDVYEKYCAQHPEFKNNKTISAKERIKAAYDGCMEQDDFL